MVQTSYEPRREVNVEIRNGMRYFHNSNQQKHKGWYWCAEKQGFFRFSDWNRPKSDFYK
jgi:hypothetical protein